MLRALVTGGTGFVGSNLVELLRGQGLQVCCLVRDPSKARHLQDWGTDLQVGSLLDSAAVAAALADVDVVFHVAGRVSAFKPTEFWTDNVEGTRCVVEQCSQVPIPPKVIVVSSLAAGGPSSPGNARLETEPDHPISEYGKTKLAAEHAAAEYAPRVPLSIVRPPVVFGKGDRNGLTLFKTLKTIRLHLLPGYHTMPMSIVHVADLCQALLLVAQQGARIESPANLAGGRYYVTSGPTVTYKEFGKLAAQALGYTVATIPVPGLIFKMAGAAAEEISKLRGQPSIFNRDKVREGLAAGWECSDAKLCQELGYRPEKSLEARFAETAAWYREQGWL